jgi:purine-binding chemotaxis protein CheW
MHFFEAENDLTTKITILKQRAKHLAQSQPPEIKPLLLVTVFTLGKESYAVGLDFLQEVFPLHSLTPIPGLPSYIAGIINLRGNIYSVINLKSLFDLPDPETNTNSYVIILADQTMEFGILADKIEDIRSIPVTEIQSTLPSLQDPLRRYFKGVTSTGLIILEAESLLQDETLIFKE